MHLTRSGPDSLHPPTAPAAFTCEMAGPETQGRSAMFPILKLARNRLRSEDDYRAMQAYIANRALDELEHRGIEIATCDVLELAAGLGGYSTVLNRRARSFLANDMTEKTFFEDHGIPFHAFDVTEPFPLPSESFDLIYCSSLIEHVAEPAKLLRECRRVLRSDGTLYLSFPPFYSLALVGGHGFKPYHLLGESMALRAYNRRHGTDLESYAEVGNNLALYPLRIGEVSRLITEAGFEISQTFTRMSLVNTAKWPWFLKDLATWHVCYLARPAASA